MNCASSDAVWKGVGWYLGKYNKNTLYSVKEPC